MRRIVCVQIFKLPQIHKKKFRAVFEFEKIPKKQRFKTVYFGASGYQDYTIHKDIERKKKYILRHKSREDWNNPVSAGSLSFFILWNKTSIKSSIADYKKKFKIPKIIFHD